MLRVRSRQPTGSGPGSRMLECLHMALTIENPEVERLAHELARMTGEPVDLAVEKALRHELVTAPTRHGKSVREIVREAQERLAELPVLDTRTPDEIIGYNEFGHFD